MTAISETRNLTTLTTVALFDKLREHELEMTRLKEMESFEKKSRSLALKKKLEILSPVKRVQMSAVMLKISIY